MAGLAKSRATRGVIVGLVVLIAIIVGGVSGSIAFAEDSARSRVPSGLATTIWPTNEKGMTYGSSMNATCPEDEPDLIQAEATNGRRGYVLRSDPEGPIPKSPQEALALQVAQAGRDEVIPVYESDGTTIIGSFIIQHGGATLVTAPSASE